MGVGRISLITLFGDRHDLAIAFMRQWRALRGTPAFDFVELLWGDCGSSDGTSEMLRRADDIASVTLFSENPGFARGNNQLAASASGEILLFLDYDISVTPQWLEQPVNGFVDRPHLGILGNIQISIRSRTPDHCGVFFHAEGDSFHFRPALECLGNVPLFPVPAVTGACLAIRRELFEQLGGFDESYINGCADIDLCLRARKAGAEIAVATRSVIWRHSCSSAESHPRAQEDADRFLARWGDYVRELSRFQPPDLPEIPRLQAQHDPRRDHQSLQVFIPTAGGFTEDASVYQLYRRERFTRVEISLPPLDPAAKPVVRIDPSTEHGCLHLGGLTLRVESDHRVLWQARGRDLDACCHPAGSARRVHETKGWKIESTGTDPQVLIWLPPALVPTLTRECTTLHAWLKWKSLPTEPVAASRAQRSWLPWLRRRRTGPLNIAVDLTPLRPGDADREIKTFVLALLKDLATRHGHELRFRIAAFPALIAELRTFLAPCEIMRYSGLDVLEEPRLFDGIDVLYAPLGRSQFFRAEIPRVSLIADLLHRDHPELLPPDEGAARERWMVETLASSDLLQCNSQLVVERLYHHYGIEADRTLVVNSGSLDQIGAGPEDTTSRTRPQAVTTQGARMFPLAAEVDKLAAALLGLAQRTAGRLRR